MIYKTLCYIDCITDISIFISNVLLEIKSLVPTCLGMSTQFSEKDQRVIVSVLVNNAEYYS